MEHYPGVIRAKKFYYSLPDLEKKELLRVFVESVEIYPEKLDNGYMLKRQ